MERIKVIADHRLGIDRPIVLSIAGMDPSGGAGLLSDMKTYEYSRVYGLGINTGNTIQTDLNFFDIHWTPFDFIEMSVKQLANRFEVSALKIGILPSLSYLYQLIQLLQESWPRARIIWDPVIRSSTDFQFMKTAGWQDAQKEDLKQILRQITLLTPNLSEVSALAEAFNMDIHETMLAKEADVVDRAGEIISSCCPVLIKGGHSQRTKGKDFLYITADNTAYGKVEQSSGTAVGKAQRHVINPDEVKRCTEKHGSGCVLSAAITAAMAKGHDLLSSCRQGKKYTTAFLLSNQTLLGLHVQ